MKELAHETVKLPGANKVPTKMIKAYSRYMRFAFKIEFLLKLLQDFVRVFFDNACSAPEHVLNKTKKIAGNTIKKALVYHRSYWECKILAKKNKQGFMDFIILFQYLQAA